MEPPRALRLGAIGAVALAACAVALGYQDSAVPREVGGAHISPDGSAVLFMRAGNIWRVPFGGGDEQRVTTAEPVSGHPRSSPDAKQIAFLHRPLDGTGPSQIFVMPADSQTARTITPASIDVGVFEWSRSSRRIAFVSKAQGLWVVVADGNGLRMLRGGLSTGFAWSPDDSAIVRTTGERSIGPL